MLEEERKKGRVKISAAAERAYLEQFSDSGNKDITILHDARLQMCMLPCYTDE